MTDEIERLRALSPVKVEGPSVKVKPLEWATQSDVTQTFLHSVKQIGHPYQAFCENLMYFAYCGSTEISRASSIEEAKAHCQADYERRIRSTFVEQVTDETAERGEQ